jgi:hypothetical protein
MGGKLFLRHLADAAQRAALRVVPAAAQAEPDAM